VPARAAAFPERAHAAADHIAEVDGLRVQHDLACGRPRDVEEVVDETSQVVGLAPDDLS
jgi:hypothetical protein